MACKVVCRSLWSHASRLPVSPLQRQNRVAINRISQTAISLRHLPGRCLHTSCRCNKSFNVQDGEDFTERVIKSDIPTVVDFHATWCQPCKILGPRLEKIIGENDGKVQLAKVDIDDNTDLAMEYGVSAVPTVIFMKKGDKISEFIGLKDDDELESLVEEIINYKTPSVV